MDCSSTLSDIHRSLVQIRLEGFFSSIVTKIPPPPFGTVCVRDDGSRTVQEYSENILLACTGAGLALPRHSQLCVVSVTVVIAAIVIQMSEVFLFSDGS